MARVQSRGAVRVNRPYLKPHSRYNPNAPRNLVILHRDGVHFLRLLGFFACS